MESPYIFTPYINRLSVRKWTLFRQKKNAWEVSRKIIKKLQFNLKTNNKKTTLICILYFSTHIVTIGCHQFLFIDHTGLMTDGTSPLENWYPPLILVSTSADNKKRFIFEIFQIHNVYQ
jgi:hypothetical protein